METSGFAPQKKKFKIQPSSGKLMLTVFQESQSTGTLSGKGHCNEHEMLTNKLKPENRSKRQRLLSKEVVLLHGNFRPHIDTDIVETNKNFEVLAHPPYSSDLASSELRLFSPLKQV
ncbi:hypothetical protein LAZ67_4001845 [Cordylochernes scorpioides]|uniref:Histone-lysine N-methyltransferase SETMAR n=1 Tax=Cordylochernes scorpioides TaxID=51811 RepID=A0ABY6KCH1_9ARAC|nr:hypothetical protein LAZ67_4001845 [Cordylochernes scorpioides]